MQFQAPQDAFGVCQSGLKDLRPFKNYLQSKFDALVRNLLRLLTGTVYALSGRVVQIVAWLETCPIEPAESARKTRLNMQRSRGRQGRGIKPHPTASADFFEASD